MGNPTSDSVGGDWLSDSEESTLIVTRDNYNGSSVSLV